MLYPVSPRAQELRRRVRAFIDTHVVPSEGEYQRQLDAMPTRWGAPPLMEELKAKARAEELWNLFLPRREYAGALSNLEYAVICEEMGRSPIGAEPFNCSAPDTGNMETLASNGDWEQSIELDARRVWIEMDGDRLPVLPLEHERTEYLKIGRVPTAELIDRWIVDHRAG